MTGTEEQGTRDSSSGAGTKRPAPDPEGPVAEATGASGHRTSSPPPKRRQPDPSVGEAASTGPALTPASSSAAPAAEAVDVARSVGLRPGDRIEVKWDLHIEEGTDAAGGEGAGPAAEGEAAPAVTRTIPKWWGATLLHPDGRTHTLTDRGETGPGEMPGPPRDSAAVPVRSLDYDPCPEHGFPERSLEDVAILSDRSLLNLSSGTRAHWRKEGSEWEPSEGEHIADDGVGGETFPPAAAASVSPSSFLSGRTLTASTEEEVRSVLDAVLVTALGTVSDKMGRLDAAQSSWVAGRIASAKERLLERIVRDSDSQASGAGGGGPLDITPQYIRQCMQELGPELTEDGGEGLY